MIPMILYHISIIMLFLMTLYLDRTIHHPMNWFRSILLIQTVTDFSVDLLLVILHTQMHQIWFQLIHFHRLLHRWRSTTITPHLPNWTSVHLFLRVLTVHLSVTDIILNSDILIIIIIIITGSILNNWLDSSDQPSMRLYFIFHFSQMLNYQFLSTVFPSHKKCLQCRCLVVPI